MKRNKILLVSIFIIAMVALSMNFASATDIDTSNATYVANDTSNPSPNGSVDNPYNGIKDGLDNSNGVVILDEGIYKGQNNTAITINKNITLIGANYFNSSKGETIIDGDGLYQIFNIAAGTNVTLINLQIKNSLVSSGSSNGVINSLADYLTIINCSFYNNSAYSNGIINVYTTSTTIFPNLTVINSIFTNNNARGTQGDCIRYRASGFLNITGSTFNNWVSGGQYGAVFYYGNSGGLGGIIDKCIFSNNTGSLFADVTISGIQSIPFDVTHSIFNSNGISIRNAGTGSITYWNYNIFNFRDATYTVTGSTGNFDNNLWVRTSPVNTEKYFESFFNFDNNKIYYNITSNNELADINLLPDAFIDYIIRSENSSLQNSFNIKQNITLDKDEISVFKYSFFGITLLNYFVAFISTNGNDENSGLSLNDPLLSIKKAIEGGATKIFIDAGVYKGENNTNLTIDRDLDIIGSGNTIIDGEGLNWIFNILSGVKVNLEGITFKNAYKNNGGAISNAGILTIENSSFINNTATANGGAIYSSAGSLAIENSSFINNSATGDGGSIYLSSTSLTLINSNFINNRATNGGAIAGVANLNIGNSKFINNSATNNGGAIYQNGGVGDITIQDSSFINNTANISTGIGGAIYLQKAAGNVPNQNITRCNFISNHASDYEAIYMPGGGNRNVPATTPFPGIVESCYFENTGNIRQINVYSGNTNFNYNIFNIGNIGLSNGAIIANPRNWYLNDIDGLTYVSTVVLENGVVYYKFGLKGDIPSDLSLLPDFTGVININGVLTEFNAKEDNNFTVGNNSFSIATGLKTYSPNLNIVVDHVHGNYGDNLLPYVNNTFVVNVTNTGNIDLRNVTIVFYTNDSGQLVSVGQYTIDSLLAGENKTFNFVDPTIRQSNGNNTIIGNNNSIILYKIDAGFASLEKSYPLVYSGYVSKEYSWEQSNLTNTRTYNITGGIIVTPISGYTSAGTSGISSTPNIVLPAGSNVVEVLLYVYYNWAHTSNPYPDFEVKFNNQPLDMIAYYWDHANHNASGYGTLKYGVLVYNVTSLIKNGYNLFDLSRITNSALYPAQLVILYNNTNVGNQTPKTVYINEGTDVFEPSGYGGYNDVNQKSIFSLSQEKDGILNATWYVIGGSGNGGDGNLIFNGKEFTNPFNGGNSESLNLFIADVTDSVNKENIGVLTAPGTTFVSFNQILVVEEKISTNITVSNSTNNLTTIVTLKDQFGNIIANQNVTLFIGSDNYTISTDDDGIAIFEVDTTNKSFRVEYLGNNDYYPISYVSNYSPVLKNTNLNITYSIVNHGPVIVLTLTDSDGNKLNNQNVSLLINGKTYTGLTNNEGKYTFIFAQGVLNPGTYNLLANFIGDTEFNPTNSTLNGLVVPQINNTNNTTTKTKTSLTLSTSTIYKGQKTNIIATLKGSNNKAIANQKITLTINKKTYTAITNSKGIATFKISGLKSNKYTVTAKYSGNTLYQASSISKSQTVKKVADLIITKVKRSGNNYKVVVKNQGDLNSKKTKILISYKVGKKTKYKKAYVKAIKAGKSLTVNVKFFKHSTHKKYKKTAKVNYNKATKEINYKNNVKAFKV